MCEHVRTTTYRIWKSAVWLKLVLWFSIYSVSRSNIRSHFFIRSSGFGLPTQTYFLLKCKLKKLWKNLTIIIAQKIWLWNWPWINWLKRKALNLFSLKKQNGMLHPSLGWAVLLLRAWPPYVGSMNEWMKVLFLVSKILLWMRNILVMWNCVVTHLDY